MFIDDIVDIDNTSVSVNRSWNFKTSVQVISKQSRHSKRLGITFLWSIIKILKPFGTNYPNFTAPVNS